MPNVVEVRHNKYGKYNKKFFYKGSLNDLEVPLRNDQVRSENIVKYDPQAYYRTSFKFDDLITEVVVFVKGEYQRSFQCDQSKDLSNPIIRDVSGSDRRIDVETLLAKYDKELAEYKRKIFRITAPE